MNKLTITVLTVVPAYSVRDWFNFKIIGKNNFEYSFRADCCLNFTRLHARNL